MRHIRNFSIIAHVDHGKSTLADRFIQLCGGLADREMQAQVLDSMELERERGITIKAQSVTLYYSAHDGERYQLNMIDTPGHVDFSYEVSRSLAACDGALLVVDASQGVEAQSVANCYTAIEQGLEVLPVINKIDLPSADPERVRTRDRGDHRHRGDRCRAGQRQDRRGRAGAARGDHPAHSRRRAATRDAPLQALIIDSWFDNYVGVVSLVRVMNGGLQDRRQDPRDVDRPQPRASTASGASRPSRWSSRSSAPGTSASWSPASRRSTARRSATPSRSRTAPRAAPLPGFKQIKPRVFAGLFPVNSEDYEKFRDALAKLRLNDSALHYEPEVSGALGFGFRCGFLGLLHMDIVQERLEREYELDARHQRADGGLRGAAHRRRRSSTSTTRRSCRRTDEIEEIREPIIIANILVPPDHVGAVLKLCNDKRGTQKKMLYLGTQVSLQYELPLAEVVLDFFDRLKSVSRGYASFDYEFSHFEAAPLVKLDILINGDKVDALSIIVHRENAYQRGRELVDKMQELIPRQMFEVAVQAAIGSAVIARATVKALRKNVLAKCYGGDITRKRKLLEKQKEGKKRMKQLGQVEIPQEAFLAVLQVGRKH